MSDMLKGWTEDHSDALIALLNKHPHNMLDVCTMGNVDCELYPNRFQTGDFRGVDGKILLEAAKAGKVWINIRRGMNLHPEYKDVLDQMYGGIADFDFFSYCPGAISFR